MKITKNGTNLWNNTFCCNYCNTEYETQSIYDYKIYGHSGDITGVATCCPICAEHNDCTELIVAKNEHNTCKDRRLTTLAKDLGLNGE